MIFLCLVLPCCVFFKQKTAYEMRISDWSTDVCASDLVDLAEVAARAVAAFGSDDAPTELALAFDYRIQHLLVDEFQDTSGTQSELLKRLTSGWQAGDSRTLFVVGDPMQSIYRFREAEVGLYLRARRFGIAHTLGRALSRERVCHDGEIPGVA